MVKNSSSFLKVRCGGCKNDQIVFGTPTTVVKCLVCNVVICKPTGGKADFSGVNVLEVLN